MVYANLRAEMTRNGYTYSTMAESIGISKSSFVDKMTGKSRFSLDEGIAIKNVLNVQLPLESLFAKVSK